MSRITARSENDPVSQAIANSSLTAGTRPVPLFATNYDISIHGGLADVVAKRLFRNVEKDSIEATITFPLPVHAMLYGLEARVGDRVLKAKARAKSDARADYEDAIDRGKTAVLHEELIKGIHLLSVGHIASGSDIEITVRFALSLSSVDGRIILRIPTTVGDVYGDSGLQDCDDLVHGGPLQTASLTVACSSGDATLVGGNLVNGKSSMALNAPIEIEVKNWVARDVVGRAADGSSVKLGLKPASGDRGVIDAAILVDHSGSMGESCGGHVAASKHAAAVLGLDAAGGDLREGDRLDLFEFDDTLRYVGRGVAQTWRALVRNLSGPRGGTEIGRAISTVISESSARDIILVTDGKSHALDVQKLARSERRFTVVLIGEDSLEANVGHLAVLTGGDILIPSGSDVSGAVKSALRSVRASRALSQGQYVRGGMIVETTWREKQVDDTGSEIGNAVAAYATSLRLAALDEKAAAQVAEAEGLVTHLTSLILVDEEGTAQQGVPTMRKVALPSPATLTYAVAAHSSVMRAGPVRMCIDDEARARSREAVSVERKKAARPEAPRSSAGSKPSVLTSVVERLLPAPPIDLSGISRSIDWAAWGSQLATGDISCLDPRVGALILKASECAAVRKAARRARISQLLMVIGVLACSASHHNRHAARVARSSLGTVSDRLKAHVAFKLGLTDFERNSAA